LKHIIIIILSGIIFGCSFLSPVAKEEQKQKKEIIDQPSSVNVSKPVKKAEEKIIVEKPEVEQVEAERKEEKIIITDEEDDDNLKSPDNTVYSISNMSITEKANGILIQLSYSGNDPRNNVTAFFSGDNFFNITFYKGKFTTAVKKYLYNKAVVRIVKFIEFKDSVQITVRLKNEFSSYFISTDKNNIMISLYN